MDPLRKRRLGNSSLEVTELGLGTAPLGDLYQRLDEARAVDTVAAGFEAGLNLFDTAPLYGRGLAEHRVGQVLRQKARDAFILSTKVGRWYRAAGTDRKGDRWAGGLAFNPVLDYSYEGTMRSYEQSLLRVGLGRIDVLLIHDVDLYTHGTPALVDRYFDEAMGGAYRALDELRRNGDIKAIGVGINESEMCVRFARAGRFDCMLLAGRYTLLEQGALDELLPLCEKLGIAIMAGGTFNSGILASGPVPGAKYDYADAPPAVIERVRRMESVCAAHGVPLPAAAIQFPLGHPSVASVVIGAVSRDELRRNVDLMRIAIPSALWTDLKSEGLVRSDAPTPRE